MAKALFDYIIAKKQLKSYNAKIADGAVTASTLADGAVEAGNIDFTTFPLADVSNSGQTSLSASFTAADHLRVYITYQPSTAMTITARFNSDSGTNYSGAYSTNCAAATTYTSQTSFNLSGGSTSVTNNFYVLDIHNKSTVIKQIRGSGSDTNGNIRISHVAWSNTSSQITSITISASTGNLGNATIYVQRVV